MLRSLKIFAAATIMSSGMFAGATINAQPLAGLGAADLIETIELSGPGAPYTGEIAVPSGKSMILKFNRPVREILVGDPATADIIPLTERNIYVLGKAVGGTNLTVFGNRKQLLGIIDLQVTHDILNLKKRIYDLMPGENIEVRSNGDSILLSGSASSSGASIRAAQLAANYVDDPENQIVNLIGIGASQQVMLAVRFAEVERTAAKALGIQPNVLFSGNDGSIGALSSGFLAPLNPVGAAASSGELFALMNSLGLQANANASNATAREFFGRFTAGRVTVDTLLEAMEEKGIATILAEPTLIAISGETASFLAGGEFPVPISSRSNDDSFRIGIEFKEFGVRLGFTPTVIGETISMIVTPEVSELAPQSGISIEGVTIPGLRTRRATTTVELKNGQSFAIAGLIQKQFIDGLDQIPGVSSTPILGALTRSTRFERQETELAIIITPYIVEPSDPSTVRAPTDFFVRPHELDLFLLGQLEGRQPFDFQPKKSYFAPSAAGTGSAAGVDGAVGYVIE